MREQVCASILIDMNSAGRRDPAIVSDRHMEPGVVAIGMPPLTIVPGGI